MLRIAIHLSTSSNSSTSESNETMHLNQIDDNSHTVNRFYSTLTSDKDIKLDSLTTARCDFGIVSINDTIFVAG